MLKDPTIPSILGYMAFIMSNPNNHAWEGGPVTTEMELEVVDTLLKMCGFKSGWGHLASGGSLANMEALWAARDYYGNGTVFFSEVSHYSWKRICKILNIDSFEEVAVDGNFRMDINALEDALKKTNKPLMVVANFGSTGAGSVDDLEGLIGLKTRYNFHLHIDAAYGGFFRSCILDDNYELLPYDPDGEVSLHSYNQLKHFTEADSITIDPHKQGFMQYGAGAVIYKDDALREPLSNTAPYTYHKTDKPNIGMFSLEGSRPGAMAAACYLTYKVLPPVATGLGSLLKLSLASANKFSELIDLSDKFNNFSKNDLDICTATTIKGDDMADINKKNLEIYQKLSVENPDAPFIISKFVVSPQIASRAIPKLTNINNENFSALRTIFMKHWNALDDFRYVKQLVEEMEFPGIRY
ncbi:aminotransferase class V-fold PLP-dependent enzyme [Ignavibacteriales bacterium]